MSLDAIDDERLGELATHVIEDETNRPLVNMNRAKQRSIGEALRRELEYAGYEIRRVVQG